MRWLADVAIHRADPNCALEFGLMAEMHFENGVQLNTDHIVSEELTDDVHVYITLQGN